MSEPTNGQKVLVVEDEASIASFVAMYLKKAGFGVSIAPSGGEALERAESEEPAIVLLDLGLPDIDGIEALKKMREKGLRAPVLILTARDGLKDRVNGLDAGADDYLGKPFELMELEARVRALLRRTRAGDAEQMRFGSVSFDAGERQMFVNGKPLLLTAREIAVLEALLAKAGRIVSKENIFSSIYDLESDASTSAIEVYVSRVRKKLDAAGAGVGIRVLRGLGYRLELAEDAAISA